MEIPRYWRIGKQRFLIGEVCPHCDAKIFPPRPKHQGCQNDERPIEIHSETTTIFSSKLPLNTSGSCMASPGKEPQPQEQ